MSVSAIRRMYEKSSPSSASFTFANYGSPVFTCYGGPLGTDATCPPYLKRTESDEWHPEGVSAMFPTDDIQGATRSPSD